MGPRSEKRREDCPNARDKVGLFLLHSKTLLFIINPSVRHGERLFVVLVMPVYLLLKVFNRARDFAQSSVKTVDRRRRAGVF